MDKYTFAPKSPSKRGKFIVTIIADSNDGDCITTTEEYSKETFDKYVIDELNYLQENCSGSHELKDYNYNGYGGSEYLSIPYNSWDGYCHTLSEVVVEYIDSNGTVWDVVY